MMEELQNLNKKPILENFLKVTSIENEDFPSCEDLMKKKSIYDFILGSEHVMYCCPDVKVTSAQIIRRYSSLKMDLDYKVTDETKQLKKHTYLCIEKQ